MPRLCVILHDLGPDHPLGWRRIEQAAAAGDPVTVLHTGSAVGADVTAIPARVKAAGAEYRALSELAPAEAAPVFPAIPTHRMGRRIAAAVAALAADILWFCGSPAHAAATADARQCGMPGIAQAKIVLELFTLGEFQRARDGVFPTGGRDDLANDFLERRAVAGADEMVCADRELSEWIGRSGGSPLSVEASGEPPLPRPPLPPTISVCVPYYEKQDYLEAALASLAAQTQPPHEVIVIDDGSPSAAAAAAWERAARHYSPRGWKFIRQPNGGPAAARNRAAREAGGDALLFCDADNRFRPEMIATLARAMAGSGADLVTCAFEAFSGGEGGEPIKPVFIFAPLGACAELALLENVLGDTNSLFRRSAFLDAGGFVAGLMNEDWRLLLEWVRAGRSYAATPEILFDYRLGPTSRSRTESEFASASAVVAPLLASEPTLARLWPHLAGLVRDPRAARLADEVAQLAPEVKRLEGEFNRLTAEIVQVHGDLAQERAVSADLKSTLETARQIDRVNRAHVFLLERLTAEQKTSEIAAKSTAGELRQQLAALTTRSAREQAIAEASLQALRGRMERMQASFSWRATGWLRALRRRWLDRPPAPVAESSAPAPTSLPILHHIDAPRLWSAEEPNVTIRGWTFPQADTVFTAVRARVGARSYPGVYRMERPDLAGIFPQWPGAAFAGFKVDVQFLPDDTEVALDGQDEAGTWHLIVARSLTGADSAASAGTYRHWLAQYPDPDAAALARLRSQADSLGSRKISVLMPVYNPAEKWLVRAIESVREQSYPHWELCIADDASTSPHVRAVLERFARQDSRIKVTYRPANGHISAATNSALELATGEFTAMFDHDDELAPHALHCVAAELAAHPEADLIYSDEDKIDEQGVRFDPHFKPDWNPELLCAQNYISHLSVFRTSVLRDAGGLQVGFEGSQDWDLLLRVTDRIPAEHIRHIPRVLYHWRANEGSTALHLGEKKYIADSSRRALEEHFARTGQAVQLERIAGGHWHAAYPLPKLRPLVSIIIPTRNAGELVRLCLASIFARTNYAPFEIILVDNRSDDPASREIFAAAEREDGVRVLRYDQPFNYSAINNFAARQAQGEILCLLNNDIEVMETHWLDEMVAHALRPTVGAVGARLYYPDLRVQHAGVITGLGGVAGHGFKYFERGDPGTPQFRPHLAQNLTAVTAACLVIRKSVYFEAGGFDETELTVAFNDVDFCLKVAALGYRNVYAPFAELVHHESASRGKEDTPEKIRRFQSEIAAIKARWGERLLRDPAYNPNLSLDSEDFALAYPPRVPPW